MKRLFSMSGQREALPDSGSHHLFNTLLAVATFTPGEPITTSLAIWGGDRPPQEGFPLVIVQHSPSLL